MLHGLACVLAHVGDDAVAVFQPLLLGQLCDDGEDVAQQGGILLGQHSGRGDVLAGDHKEMHLCLRVDVVECHHLVILVQLFRGDLALCDHAKQTIFHGEHSFLLLQKPAAPARIRHRAGTWILFSPEPS